GYPVIMDGTHSTQRPGGSSGVSGGNPEYAPYFAKNALICGADGLFFEVHKEPKTAKSDGTNMLRIDEFEKVLTECKAVYDLVRN
ncbi:MAG: 3-deoxy-8-phosphooctulonate synthase, partial [Campylobacterales bacterium]|nr:3-deoxy-8-phosphooctulonate synthase [Campylobacterales bacterium]